MIGCCRRGRSHSQECGCGSNQQQLWGLERLTAAGSHPETHTDINTHQHTQTNITRMRTHTSYTHTPHTHTHTPQTHTYINTHTHLIQTHTLSHLKQFFIQESRPKHRHSIRADLRLWASEKVKGRHFLTIQVQCDLLTFHAIGHSVPPAGSEVTVSERNQRTPAGWLMSFKGLIQPEMWLGLNISTLLKLCSLWTDSNGSSHDLLLQWAQQTLTHKNKAIMLYH